MKVTNMNPILGNAARVTVPPILNNISAQLLESVFMRGAMLMNV